MIASEWKRFKDKKPARDLDVLILSKDGRMWVGQRCSLDDCNELHYQSNSHEVNYIPEPEYWASLSVKL